MRLDTAGNGERAAHRRVRPTIVPEGASALSGPAQGLPPGPRWGTPAPPQGPAPARPEARAERAQYWLGVGAQPTEAVAAIFRVTGDWQKFKGEPAPAPMRVAEPKPDKKALYEAAVRSGMDEPTTDATTAKKKAAPKKAAAADEAPAADAPAAEAATEAPAADATPAETPAE